MMQRDKPTPPDLLSGNEYHRSLIQAITKSQRRVMITAMTVAYDKATRPIFDELFAALDRGVEVTLVFDEFTKSPFAPGIISYFKEGSRLLKETLQVCDKLRSKGASVTFVRPLGVNHFKGRYHAKAVVIDDQWYAFGGMNFCAEAFLVTDYMLNRHSKKEANGIAKLINSFRQNLILQDYTETFGDNTIIVDAGLQNHSMIYDTVCNLASRSHTAIYISQLQPTGVLATLLAAIDTTYYFNRPDQLGFPGNYAAIVDSFHLKGKNSYKGDSFIHAKCILFILEDGTRTLVSGSHNFHWRGVAYGTQEIALVSKDTTLWNEMFHFIQEKV